MKFPGHIYFDTNILRKLRKEINTPEYQVLRKITKDLNICIAIPEIVEKEWIHYHIEERAKTNIEAFEKLASKLSSDVPIKEDVKISINKDKILADLNHYLADRLVKEEIKIIKTPKIEIDSLIEKAVRKIKPFKDEDVGFKDTMILMTLLNYATNFPEDGHLFITDDSVFYEDEIKNAALEHKIDLTVLKSVQEAIEYLRTFLKKTIKEMMEKRSHNLNRFLMEQKENIADYIKKNARFDENMFLSELGRDPSVFGQIQSIKDIELKEIINSNAGFLKLNKKKDWVDVSFQAKLSFAVLIKYSPSIPFTSKLAVGIDRDLMQVSRWLPILSKPEFRDGIIAKNITINAEAQVDEAGKFYDIRFPFPMEF
jgi:hypothetical protein